MAPSQSAGACRRRARSGPVGVDASTRLQSCAASSRSTQAVAESFIRLGLGTGRGSEACKGAGGSPGGQGARVVSRALPQARPRREWHAAILQGGRGHAALCFVPGLRRGEQGMHRACTTSDPAPRTFELYLLQTDFSRAERKQGWLLTIQGDPNPSHFLGWWVAGTFSSLQLCSPAHSPRPLPCCIA